MTREEAILILEEEAEFLYGGDEPYNKTAFDMAIEVLSTDTTQGKWIKHKGEWVDLDFYPTKYECSQCHYCVDEGHDSIFCPNCGAKMKGGAE